MNEENVVSTHNGIFFSVLEKKEILQYVTTWMNLEDMMLSDISQTYCVIPPILGT